jgi:membrane protein YdbS with pleckstrin-like domain
LTIDDFQLTIPIRWYPTSHHRQFEIQMIQLHCDACERLFEAPDDQAGQKIACPYCGDINRVPPAGQVVEPAAQRSTNAPTGRAIADEPEKVIAVVRQAMFRAHPFWYLLMLFTFVGGLYLAYMGWQATAMGGGGTSQPTTQATSGAPHWVMYVGFIAIVIALVWWFGWWAKPGRWTKLVITTRRVTMQHGILNRVSNDVFHTKIQDIKVEQTFFQRIMGVGYMGIDSAGQGGDIEDVPGQPERRSAYEIEMHDMPRPSRVRELINRYRR